MMKTIELQCRKGDKWFTLNHRTAAMGKERENQLRELERFRRELERFRRELERFRQRWSVQPDFWDHQFRIVEV